MSLVNNAFIYNDIHFKPAIFQVDFELAMINAIREIFPDLCIRGCYFHFAKALWKNVQEFGLARLYRNSRKFKFYVKICSVIPLVPLNAMQDALVTCNSLKPENNISIDNFHFYLWNTWFSIDSIYKINIWTHFDNYGPRTIIIWRVFTAKCTGHWKKRIPIFLRL